MKGNLSSLKDVIITANDLPSLPAEVIGMKAIMKRIDRRQMKTNAGKLQSIHAHAVAATTSQQALSQIDPAMAERRVADRKKITKLVPWDSDEVILRDMCGPNHEAFEERLRAYLNLVSQTREISTMGMGACFSPRYLRTHIWDMYRVR